MGKNNIYSIVYFLNKQQHGNGTNFRPRVKDFEYVFSFYL